MMLETLTDMESIEIYPESKTSTENRCKSMTCLKYLTQNKQNLIELNTIHSEWMQPIYLLNIVH